MKDYRIPVIVVLVVLALLFVGILPPGISIMTSVPAGHTGILTTYGKVEDTYLKSGIHFKRPWQKIIIMDNRIQTMHISSGIENATTKDTAETKDQQLVPVFDFEIQYQLNAAKSYEVYRNYGTRYEQTLITSNALQFIKEIFALYKAEEIVTAKSEIPVLIKERLSTVTDPLGINVIRVNMVTYDFTPEYTQILEDRAMKKAQLENNRLEQQNQTIAAQTQYEVAVKEAEKQAETQRIAAENANAIAIKNAEKEAETQRIAADNENAMALAKAKAKAESDKINADNTAYVTRTQAEAEKDARIAKAEAEKAELEAKAAGLNDYVIQQQWIDKWDGELIPNFGGTGLGFTNYTDIIKEFLNTGGNDEQD